MTVLVFLFCASNFLRAAATDDHGRAEHVVLIVWDGMRPDLVTKENCPTLFDLAHDGVFFRNNHAAYPTSTNVNGAVLATGDYPAHNGVISNHEFRAEIDPLKAFDTSDFPALERGGEINAKYLAAPTVAETVQEAGFPTAIAGSKPAAQLADRSRDRASEAAKNSIVIYRGNIFPADAANAITAALGPFPQTKNVTPNAAEDDWTTRALTEQLWKTSVPKYSLLWLSDPDLTQHATAPGAPAALAAIKNDDENLARVIAALREKNALTTTDILVVSDHGFSTVDRAVDVVKELRAAGFDAVRAFTGAAKSGQVLVVSLGGSVEFYVVGHEAAIVQKLVDFLARSDFAGVILTREKMAGTFSLADVHLASATAPDVLVANRWNDRPNEFGVAGEVASDGNNLGQGTHSTLSPRDLHNTLIAAGPDFRRGFADETPTGNIDVAPTVLWLLGIKPQQKMDGRVLREALTGATSAPHATEKTLSATRNLGSESWRQTLRLTTVDNVTYFIEGNGGRK